MDDTTLPPADQLATLEWETIQVVPTSPWGATNARVAENARRLAGRAGVTLDQLATAAARSRRVMARRMSGAGRWTLDDVYNVAVALGVEPHTLVA